MDCCRKFDICVNTISLRAHHLTLERQMLYRSCYMSIVFSPDFDLLFPRPQFKRLAAFLGDMAFQAPRRFLLEIASKTQPAYSFRMLIITTWTTSTVMNSRTDIKGSFELYRLRLRFQDWVHSIHLTCRNSSCRVIPQIILAWTPLVCENFRPLLCIPY